MPKSNPPDWEKFALRGSEDSHQIALLAWTYLPEQQEAYPELKWLYAVPNGDLRSPSVAGRMKAMGVKRGVPDLCLPIKRGQYAGLYIELKRPAINGKQKAGKASNEQLDWIKHLIGQGYGAMVCVGMEEAKKALIGYLNWGK